VVIICFDNTPIMLQKLKENTKDVMRLKPSGYLTKETTNAQILEELKNLRYPVYG